MKLNNTEFVETTDETVELATEYISENLLVKQVLLIVCILL